MRHINFDIASTVIMFVLVAAIGIGVVWFANMMIDRFLGAGW